MPKPSDLPQTPEPNPLSRRRLFAGAGTAGALAVVAAVLPNADQDADLTTSGTDAQRQPPPEAGGGYQLTAHVQQYYQTTRI